LSCMLLCRFASLLVVPVPPRQPMHCPHSHAQDCGVPLVVCACWWCGLCGICCSCVAIAKWSLGAAAVTFFSFPSCSFPGIRQALSATALHCVLWTAVRCWPRVIASFMACHVTSVALGKGCVERVRTLVEPFEVGGSWQPPCRSCCTLLSCRSLGRMSPDCGVPTSSSSKSVSPCAPPIALMF
jgi:hypothetical protein